MHRVALLGRPLHQAQVAQGEGVSVHDDSPRLAGTAVLLQLFAEGGKPAPPVLQEGESSLHPGDLIKAQVLKELGTFALGVDKLVENSPLRLALHQVRDHLVEKPLPLVAVVYRKAAQGAPKGAAGSHQLVVLVKQAAGVVQIAIQGDPLPLQQGAEFCLSALIVGADLTEGIGHGVSSF